VGLGFKGGGEVWGVGVGGGCWCGRRGGRGRVGAYVGKKLGGGSEWVWSSQGGGVEGPGGEIFPGLKYGTGECWPGLTGSRRGTGMFERKQT